MDKIMKLLWILRNHLPKSTASLLGYLLAQNRINFSDIILHFIAGLIALRKTSAYLLLQTY